jgi:hypothetical protein
MPVQKILSIDTERFPRCLVKLSQLAHANIQRRNQMAAMRKKKKALKAAKK